MTKRLAQIKRHEGEKFRAYLCTAGHWTIACGYNLDANPLHLSDFEIAEFKKNGITQIISDHLTNLMISQIEIDLSKKLKWFDTLDEPRQTVLVNMAYNMGINGLLAFKNTLLAVEHGDYELAAKNMLESKWATQVHGRATELAKQMETGVYA